MARPALRSEAFDALRFLRGFRNQSVPSFPMDSVGHPETASSARAISSGVCGCRYTML